MYRSVTPLINAKSVQVRQRKTIVDNVEDDLRHKLESGFYPQGTMLPGKRALAAEYDIAQLTVQLAISRLVKQGLLRTENGRGTFVERQSAVLQSAPPAKRSQEVSLGRVAIATHLQLDDAMALQNDFDHLVESVRYLERSISMSSGISSVRSIYDLEVGQQTFPNLVHKLSGEGYEGIIVLPDYTTTHSGVIWKVAYEGVPIVVLSGDEIDCPHPYIYEDNRDAGRLAASHLNAQGCRAIVAFSPHSGSWVDERIAGAIDRTEGRIERRVGETPVPLAPPKDDLVSAAYDFAKSVLHSGASFDGVIALSDYYALGFRNAAEEAGLLPGRDYALIGFDDNVHARRFDFTTIRPPLLRAAEEAIRLLSRLIDDNHTNHRAPEPMRVCLQADLVIRESSQLLRRAERKETATAVQAK